MDWLRYVCWNCLILLLDYRSTLKSGANTGFSYTQVLSKAHELRQADADHTYTVGAHPFSNCLPLILCCAPTIDKTQFYPLAKPLQYHLLYPIVCLLMIIVYFYTFDFHLDILRYYTEHYIHTFMKTFKQNIVQLWAFTGKFSKAAGA